MLKASACTSTGRIISPGQDAKITKENKIKTGPVHFLKLLIKEQKTSEKV